MAKSTRLHSTRCRTGVRCWSATPGFIAVYHPDGDSLLMTLYTRDGNQPRFRANGFEENSRSIRFVFKDITNWKSSTEHINGLQIVLKDEDHVIEKWETLRPDGAKVGFEFELTRKKH